MRLSLQIVSAVASALPCFYLAARLNQVWRHPQSVEGGRWVYTGVGIFVLEFFLVHAGTAAGFAASRDGLGTKALTFASYAAYCFLFASGVFLAFRSRELLMTFLVVMAGRFISVVVGFAQADAGFLALQSLVSVALWFFAALFSVFGPLPRRGLTEAFVGKPSEGDDGPGLWVEEPHRALGAGVLYFTLLGLVDLLFLSWIDPAFVLDRLKHDL